MCEDNNKWDEQKKKKKKNRGFIYIARRESCPVTCNFFPAAAGLYLYCCVPTVCCIREALLLITRIDNSSTSAKIAAFRVIPHADMMFDSVGTLAPLPRGCRFAGFQDRTRKKQGGTIL